jgi:ribosome-interacting GTPase 1
MGAGLRVILVGRLVDSSMREVEALLRSYRISDAVVRISGEVTLDEVEDAIFESTTYRPAVIVANKLDVKGAGANLRRLEGYVGGRIPIVAVSCEKRLGLDRLGVALFKALGVIRVYTKEPGAREFSKRPFTLKRGATLLDLAKSIHTDFTRDFAFAKVWSERLVFSPQKVGLSFALDDGDVVEIHVR